MADYSTAAEIIRKHGGGGEKRPGSRLTLRPDVLALGGDDVLEALEGAAPPEDGTANVNRAVLFAGDCRGGGSSRRGERAKALAATYGFQFVSPAAGCSAPVLRERGLVGPGDLVAAVGLPEAQTTGEGFLVWPVACEALSGLLTRGGFEVERPDIYRIECRGELGPAVGGADVGLYLASQFERGGARGALFEVGGAAGEALDIGGRAALAGGAALSEPVAVLCAPGTPASEYEAYFEYDFSNLPPQYAARRGAAGWEVAALADAERKFVRKVVVGPSASAAEIREAARLLGGKRIHSDVQLWVSPSSRGALFEALSQGDIATLMGAGATILPACALPWAEELTSGGAVATTGYCAFDVCVTSGVEVYFVSAAAAAAAALAGELCDPTLLCKRLNSD